MPHQSFMRSEPRPEAPGLAQDPAKGKGERQDHDRHADEEHEDAIVRHKEARHHGEHSAKGDAAVGHAETGGALVSGHYERVFKDYCQGRRAPPQPGERKMATAPTTSRATKAIQKALTQPKARQTAMATTHTRMSAEKGTELSLRSFIMCGIKRASNIRKRFVDGTNRCKLFFIVTNKY